MQAATMAAPGAAPVHEQIDEPAAGQGLVRVRVHAAALSPLARSRAAGRHYSVDAPSARFVPGVDGVGVLDDGRRVYFVLPQSPHGSMAGWSVVDPSHCIALPDALDDVTAAALAIPGMSSWAALRERARFEPGGVVLVNGATGASGRLAVQVARRLGARKVIATGRNVAALESLQAVGADVVIALGQDGDALRAALEAQFAAGVDVVLDYLWGASAEAVLGAAVRAAPATLPIRYVSIGSAGGADITLPSAALRSSAIELLGSGLNSVPLPRLKDAIAQVFAAATEKAFELPIEAVALSRVAEAWGRPDAGARVVFTLGAAA
jgi:NADPH:quinone reductase-like Zn-dependent oxidoreductase